MSDGQIRDPYPIVHNKVLSPHFVNPTLRRARLIDWLNEHATNRAIVVAADAGYGKTTLLWQWEREVPFDCYWYKLDRNDRDWSLQISYLIALLAWYRDMGVDAVLDDTPAVTADGHRVAVTYRSEPELAQRFGRDAQPGEVPLGGGGRYAVESYLDHHADKLSRRFDAGSYVVLTEAMSSHDIGRGRGGVRTALHRVTADLHVVAVDSDRLYPTRLSAELVAEAPTARPLRVVESEYGHDGFLIETHQVGAVVREALGCPAVIGRPTFAITRWLTRWPTGSVPAACRDHGR